MSEKFTASNGVEISITLEGIETYLLGKGGVISGGERRWTVATGNKEGTQALREFFLAERDEELGRWRWPENREVVAWESRRSNERDVTVFDEGSGYVGYFNRSEVVDVAPNEGAVRRAARAYFAAHPASKSWHDAMPGEVWLLTLAGDDDQPAGVFDFDGVAHFSIPGIEDFSINYGRITAGRRIWPEVPNG